MQPIACAHIDDGFGPVVPAECRGGFDFTILFEEVFFSLIPSATLIVAASGRWWKLRRHEVVGSNILLQYNKLFVAGVLTFIRLAIIVLWSISSSFRTRLSVTTAVFDLIASCSVFILSHVEGKKTYRPSPILNIYLLSSGFFEIVQVRTFWLVADSKTVYPGIRNVAILWSVCLCLKVVLLILEAIPKKTRPGTILSPEEISGIYSLRTFWWLNRTLWLGRYGTLGKDDLLSFDSELKTERYSSEIADAWLQVDQDTNYALLKAIIPVLKWPLLAPAVPRLILIGFIYTQPLLIKRALNFVDRGSNENIGYGLIGATILVYCGLALFNGYYSHLLYRSITIVRGSLIEVIYRKSLKVDNIIAKEAAPTGLITADVERIDFTIEKIHSLWASVLELGIAIFLLQREVGWACIAPVIIAFLCTFCTSHISKLLPTRQKRWNQAVQHRVGLTSRMLSNMKTVKMMGYASHIAKTLQAARVVELTASESFRKIMTAVNTLVIIPKQLSAPFTFMIFVLAVHQKSRLGGIDVAQAFTALTIIELITTPVGLVLQAIPSITASLACLNRIQTYLKSPERDDQRSTWHQTYDIKSDIVISTNAGFYSDTDKSATDELLLISLKEAGFAYNSTTGGFVLKPMSFTIAQASITLVVGPIGSGKSTLLKSLLGELKLQTGDLYVGSERTAYCSQNPWLPNNTVQNCITGPLERHDLWLAEVLYTCALDKDIEQLPDGLNTEIGSRGISLSEGQKQRLALARALYSRASLLVLDDIFRSLDAKTESQVFQRLLSHDGLIRRHSLTVVLVTHSAHHLEVADKIIVLSDGALTQLGRFEDLSMCKGYIQDQILQAKPREPASISPKASVIRRRKSNQEKRQAHTKTATLAPTSHATKSRGKSLYLFYLKPIGIVRAAILLLAVVSLAFSTRFQRIWLQWWSEAQNQQALYIGIYFVLAVGSCLVFAFSFWWMWMFVVPVTASGLHEQLLDSIISAPLAYFTTIDSSIILNRFSQDMAILNGQLPINIFQALSILMICMTQIAFVAYGAKYLAIAIPITIIVVWLLSRFYLCTSQKLRLLELELKAPVYKSFTETQEGLITIRAFGWQSWYHSQCQARIDESKKAIYLLFMIQRWLNFVLDLIVAGLATVLMSLATQLRSSTDVAALGVGLSSIIGLGLNVSQFIVCYTEMENSLGAVTRIKDCVDSIQAEESSADAKPPPKDWPSNGAVEVSKVTVSYSGDENYALDDVSFTARPGQKICICGRTGSGKSTLLSTFLRLLSIQSGNILIDGIDIATVPLNIIRQSFSVIPQTPFSLPGSVRLNLSADIHTDEEMIAALGKANLWELIASRGGLDADISALSLSHGQRQLLSLATAILKRSKIVLIDEVASGVDTGTEKKIQSLIKEEFKDCTVISINHRLESAMDCDLVIVLADGKCVEKGDPRALLEEKGEFWRLVECKNS